MARIQHGEVVALGGLKDALTQIVTINANLRIAAAPVRISELTPFDYMLPQLHDDPDNFLPVTKLAVNHLFALGECMNEPEGNPELASIIPSAYTYFGQFVDHDITLELGSDRITRLNDPKLEPLSPEVIRRDIKNSRTPALDLDSVYGPTADGTPVPRNCDRLVVGGVVDSDKPRPLGKDDFNDLPRKPKSDDPRIDREALIGDARNDENLIISQLHLAFLRAHNALVARGLTFKEARKVLTQHYQWLVVHDFLKRIANNEIVNEILRHGNRFYRPQVYGTYMPLEFSVAAFRFGHSMVRRQYDYNFNFQQATAAKLDQLFTLGAFRGPLAAFRTLPQHWIIQWEKFLDIGSNDARRIDTQLVEPLANLRGEDGQPLKGIESSLAVRNLLRGYLLRIPIGQAIARALGIPALSREAIEAVASKASEDQAAVMRCSGFLERTPLWYYILAESASQSSDTLGKVGSTLVAEVLIGLVRWSEDSILSQPGWKPTLGSRPGLFTLEDLFRLANVWV